MLQDDLDMIDKVLISGNFDKCHNHPYGKAGHAFLYAEKKYIQIIGFTTVTICLLLQSVTFSQ